jgi:hypothetical protein
VVAVLGFGHRLGGRGVLGFIVHRCLAPPFVSGARP